MKPTHNIVVAERYEKNGEEKTHWNRIGVIFTGEKDGKIRTAIKIQNIPLNWNGFAQVFKIEPKQPRDDGLWGQSNNQPISDDSAMGEEIDLSEIPF